MAEQDDVPRLFYLWRNEERIADGVQWPDGAVSVRWTVPELATETWASFDDPAAAAVHDEAVMVVWRRQDSYVDPAEPA